MEQMNGFELAGRPIKVGQVTEKGETGAYGLLDDDDADRGGIEMSSTSRAALMAKLSGSHGAGMMNTIAVILYSNYWSYEVKSPIKATLE